MTEQRWVDLATFPSGFEADVVIARLESAGIPAFRESHDGTGIFGPGFQGATAFGITVRVPSEALDEARELLEDDDGSE